MSQLSQRRPESAGSAPAPLRHNSRTVRVFAVVAGLCVSNLYYVIVLLPEIAAFHHRPSQDFAHLLSSTQGGYTLGLLFVVPLGDRVELRGFGAFTVKHRAPRVGRNPRTGAAVSVAEKFVPFFKTGKDLRERLNGHKH